jgi:hypothetical protein
MIVAVTRIPIVGTILFLLGISVMYGVASEIDLASDSAWTLRCDAGPARPIKVPGGGWNSDQQSPQIQVMKDVRDFVMYDRKITIPAIYPEQAVKLCFGAVAHGCEVFLDGKQVGEHHGPQVPFEMELTELATPGKEQVLQVKAYHRRHYLMPGQKQTAEVAVGWDFPEGGDGPTRKEANDWCDWHGNSKVGYGIVRSIKMKILPAVYVDDYFIKTSVSNRQLTCDVWLKNSTDIEHKVKLGAALSSWNKSNWTYPSIPPTTVTIPPKSTLKTTIGPVSWNMGPESYWWPNIPYREKYQPQLHYLNITVSEDMKSWHTISSRFGFVEHAEGPYYYTVNGVRYTGLSDGTAEGQTSFYDSYSAPAWLPPTGPGTGAPESWKRYMRVGMNMNRLHCSPPTEYMMDAADEVGFMLIPEAPIWGNGLSRYNPAYTPQTYHDMGRASRNHPCIARYSLSNEVREPRGEMQDKWSWRPAIDDIRKADDTRPLVFEMHSQGNGRVDGIQGGHAWIMDHYTNIHEKVGDDKNIRGMGEHFWGRNSMGEFAVGCRALRTNNWCYMAGWSWINYWPNFLQGMNHDLHAWKPQDHPDRKDGIDGWGSPIVDFIQRSLHPYLVQDLGILKENPGDPKELGQGKIEWPYNLPTILAGQPVERKVEVFNGGLIGNKITLRWSAHWDKPNGPVAVKGCDIACEIEPGFHTTKTITLAVPKVDHDERKLYLVLDSIIDGKTVFHSEETCLNVITRTVESSAAFIGTDDKTQGDWQGKYGADGYELICHESKLPAYAKFAWKSGAEWIYDKATDDKRALAYFSNPPTGKDRIAAGRYGDEVVFTLDAGQTARRLTIYHLDYDRKTRKQEVEVTDSKTSQMLDKQVIDAFTDGRYQSWKIQGKVRVTIHRITGDNATIAGIFLDPVAK